MNWQGGLIRVSIAWVGIVVLGFLIFEPARLRDAVLDNRKASPTEDLSHTFSLSLRAVQDLFITDAEIVGEPAAEIEGEPAQDLEFPSVRRDRLARRALRKWQLQRDILSILGLALSPLVLIAGGGKLIGWVVRGFGRQAR